MLQEQFALTAKALGWKAPFQSGLGAQYCRTDRYCFLNAHSDLLVWKFWNSPTNKAFCPLHCFSINSIPLYPLSKHQLEIPHESLPHTRGKKMWFQLQYKSNPEPRQNPHDTHVHQLWFTNILFLKLYFRKPMPLPGDKNVRLGSHLLHFPSLQIHIPYNHLSCTWLIWITTIAWEQASTEYAKKAWHISSECCLYKGRTGWFARCAHLDVFLLTAQGAIHFLK